MLSKSSGPRPVMLRALTRLLSRHTRSAAADPLQTPQVQAARLLTLIEGTLRIFAIPFFVLALFVLVGWIGFFSLLYPWLHLVILGVFIMAFFHACGRALGLWEPVSEAEAHRRVEQAGNLHHRPFDVLTDKPIAADAEQEALWRLHRTQAEIQLRRLKWPRPNFAFARYDRYGLRYALAVLLGVVALAGWGSLGGHLLAALNPALERAMIAKPALDAWITPPAYTHLAPIMIATPAGLRLTEGVINVPAGSVLSAHLAEQSGTTPSLTANNDNTDFTAEDRKDYEITADLTAGNEIVIKRGWQKLGHWHINIQPDRAPSIAFSKTPSVSARQNIQVPYEAKDDYAVANVTLRVTPKESLPDVSADAVDITLAEPDAASVSRIGYADLTASPFAGLPVKLQLLATDGMGHQAQSEAIDFTLPEKAFFQPVARALIAVRKQLAQTPNDTPVRNTAANLMAGVAHEPGNLRNDFVLVMSLRGGAVRLLLDHSAEATRSVEDILWQAAIRIEDGQMSETASNLRKAQQDLADALDRNASEAEVQNLIDRLHQAIAQYIAQMAMRSGTHPMPPQIGTAGTQTNMLSPEDLSRMLNNLRGLSAGGNREAARQQLAQLQQMLENLQPGGQAPLSPQQLAALAQLKQLHALAQAQRELMDQSFQKRASPKDTASLAKPQEALQDQLQHMTDALKNAGGKNGENPMMNAQAQASLEEAAKAMGSASAAMQMGDADNAQAAQGQALQALQKAAQGMMAQMGKTLFNMSPDGQGQAGNDPLGREGMLPDDGDTKLPAQSEVTHVRQILDELQRRAGDNSRSKTERDYIERLLQNF